MNVIHKTGSTWRQRGIEPRSQVILVWTCGFWNMPAGIHTHRPTGPQTYRHKNCNNSHPSRRRNKHNAWWLDCVECPQYSFRLEALAVYFLHSTRPSVTWLNSRSSLAACDWLITSSGYAHLDSRRFRQPTFDVAENLENVSCRECTGQTNDFELILTVRMETIHPVEGSFGNEFSPIYKRCRVVAAWSRKTLKKKYFLFLFLEKRPIAGKFSKFCSERIYRHTDWVVFSKFVKFGRRKSVKSWYVFSGTFNPTQSINQAKLQRNIGFTFERAPYARFYRFPSAKFHELWTHNSVIMCMCLANQETTTPRRRHERSYPTPGLVSTGMGDRLWAGIQSRYVTSQLRQLSLASLRGR